MKKIFFILLILTASNVEGQEVYNLSRVLDSIAAANPVVRMYDAEIRSMDEAARGASSWMPPEAGAGFFMTPYNPERWKKMDGEEGMGSFMVSVQQMFPSRKKQDADAAYMQSMSASAAEEKKAALNDLYAQAKKAYVEWLIIAKKRAVLGENEKILEFMITNAEIRYRNGLEKINAYYKAKAALGYIQSMQLMLDNEMQQKRILLNSLMYRDPNTVFVIDTILSVKGEMAFRFDSLHFVQNRSDVRSIDRQILTNQLKMQSEKMSLRPQFGIRLEHLTGFGGQPAQFTLMGMVKLPLVSWASRMTKANIESYRWQNEALYIQRSMLLNEAAGMAAGMRAEIEVKRKLVRLYETNIIPALRNNYKTMLLAYEQNTEELFMLFDAWESLNMTQNDHLEQLQQLLVMQVQLERVLEIK